jgi:glucokinase
MDILAIGVDLGATKTAIALVDSSGKVRASQVILTLPEKSPEQAMQRIAEAIDSFTATTEQEVDGVGVGSAGLIDPQKGILLYGKNLYWRDVHLVNGIKKHLKAQLPIHLQTDTNAQVIGEYYFGAAQGHNDFVYVTLGSGLGGAVVANGQLVTGSKNFAGVVGLLSLDPDGRPDDSGVRGCTETVLSGRGLITITKEIYAQGEYSTSLQISAGLSAEAILEAAKSGDALAMEALTEMGKYLGQVMSYFVAILNPSMIVIAGGLGKAAFDWLIPVAKTELECRTYVDVYKDLQIVPSRLESSAVGAACLVFSSLGLKPAQGRTKPA